MSTMHIEARPLKRFTVWANEDLQATFEEHWQALQYVDEVRDTLRAVANESECLIIVQILEWECPIGHILFINPEVLCAI